MAPDPPAGGGARRRSPASEASEAAERRGSGEREGARTLRLLFVCTGNTCRSPMAEVVARHEAARRGLSGVEVRSAGTMAGSGTPASALAEEAVASRGLELSSHRSRQLSRADVAWADLVLGMNASHVAAVLATDPMVQVDLLSSYLPEGHPGHGRPVLDPIGGTRADYDRTLEVLVEAVGGLLEALEGPAADEPDGRPAEGHDEAEGA